MQASTVSSIRSRPWQSGAANPPSPSASTTSADLPEPRTNLADLPDDIVHQLMAWLMRTEGTEKSVAQLAGVSKRLFDAAKEFHDSASRSAIRSTWDHHRAIEWTRAHLVSVRFAHLGSLEVTSEGALKNMLESFSSLAETLPYNLLIAEDRTKKALTGDWLEGFRNYTGRYLSIRSSAQPWEGATMVEIARALPTRTCMGLEIHGVQASLPDATKLMEQVASTGRMTGFSLLSEKDSVIALNGLEKLVGVLCDPGRIQWLRLNTLDDASPLLADLARRCGDLHAVRLVTIVCDKGVDDEALLALRDALLDRQQRGKSRISFAIHCKEWLANQYAGSPLASDAERATMEDAGLYFGRIWTPFDKAMFKKLHASVAEGPVVEWRRRPVEEKHSEALVVCRKNREKCVVS